MASPINTTYGVVYLVGDLTLTRLLLSDGTSGAPSISFASEPGLGFWRSSAGIITTQGVFNAPNGITTSQMGIVSTGQLFWSARATTQSPANGQIGIGNYAYDIGSVLKVDALPTVGSGFGTSPVVTAGSTPLAGQVDVGTGGVATSGTILFNGTAFPSAPFVVITCSGGAGVQTVVATTTQITITSSLAWPANTKVNWVCISPK